MKMTRGVDLTLQVIAKSKNQAALTLLESAVLSTNEAMRQLAGTALVARHSRRGLEAIIRNFDPADSELVDLVNDNRSKFIPELHSAIVDKDITLAKQAFRLAYTQNFYEVLPTLAAYCLGPASEEQSVVALHAGFFNFLDKYTDALEKDNPSEHRLLYGILLPECAKLLIYKISEYRFTRNELALTVYLCLYPFFKESGTAQDLTLQLRLPHSPVYASTYRRLLKQSEPYLFQLMIRTLDRPNPPPLISQIFSERSDIPFLTAMCRSIKQPLSLELKTNLAALPPLTWLGQIDSFLDQFDAEAQCGLILLLQNINLTEEELRACLLKIFERDNSEGRVAALSALTASSGETVDRFLWEASADEDPKVQVEALTQLHARKVPGAAAHIMQFADSPHEEVRAVIPKLIPNLRFSHFMQTFEQLDDAHRRRMFNVVRLLDRQTPKELTKMLGTSEPLLRAKALLCIDYCLEIVPLVEEALCEILARDEMPRLRIKAAEQLVAGKRTESRMTLVQALHRDGNPDVRAAAKNSLANRPTHWE